MKFNTVIALASVLLVTSVQGKEVAGVDLEEVARLSVANTELLLNGSAVKKSAQHSVYVGGLYLKTQSSSLEDIINDPNPKRFLFYCSTKKISAKKLIKAWEQGFNINYSKEELAALEPLISIFNTVWANGLKEGDEVWVDFIPEQGTRISLNGEIVARIPNEKFYNAFLKTWLGPHPFNARLKSALLGK